MAQRLECGISKTREENIYMVIVLLLILLVVVAFSFAEEYIEDYKIYVYSFVGLILILYAGCKAVGFDNDSENYEMYFLHNDDPMLAITVEYSFLLLSQIFNIFTSDVHIMFFFYAGIGITLKMLAIKRLSDLWFLPMIVYLGNYYILHDLTQIRAAIVSGVFLLALIPLAEGRKKIAATLILVGCIFHYSTIALFPALFLSNKDMSSNERVAWASLVPIGFFIYFLHISIFTQIPIPYIGDKIELYQELSEKGIMGDEINVFNAVYLVTCLTYLYILLFYNLVKEHNKYLPLMLKCSGISVFSFTAFSSLPVVAFRVCELYGIVQIIIFSNIYYTIKPGWLGKLAVTVVGVTLFCVNAFYAEILHP